EDVLDEPAHARDLGRLDVEERKALDGADVHTRTGDVGQLGGDDEIAAGALELPGETAQVAGLGGGGAADGEGVGLQLLGAGDHVGAGEDRDGRVEVAHRRGAL